MPLTKAQIEQLSALFNDFDVGVCYLGLVALPLEIGLLIAD